MRVDGTGRARTLMLMQYVVGGVVVQVAGKGGHAGGHRHASTVGISRWIAPHA